MDPRDEQSKIWHNREFIQWNDAKIHVMSHVIHYGSSFFEGIRCYKTSRGPGIFRLQDHIHRLFNSAKIYRVIIPFTEEEIVTACIELIRVNECESAYIRPVVFRGYHSLGVDPTKCPVEVYIGTLNWGAYLGASAINIGVDVCISTWNRMAPNTMPVLSKSGANYMNSQLIKMEAMAGGFSEGIALDTFGFLSEGSGENLFVVLNGAIMTPPLCSSILPGITRDCVFKIAAEFEIPVKEMNIPREMLYIADEVFFSGTAAEVSPVKSVDRIPIGTGKRGPVTEKIQKRYFQYVNGEIEDIYNWLTIVQ